MTSERTVLRRRAALSFAVTAIVAGIFWSNSRVPALQQKAAMGGRTDLGRLGFEVLFPEGVELGLGARVLQTALEWGVTNWRGMTFGVLFAACIMTFLASFPRRTAQGGLRGTLKGVLQGLATGVPLGLCANCATPVAQGMYRSGLSVEASLAAVLSSPTLNPIVLGMVFSMFSLEIAVLKVALTLAVVFVGMPMLVRFLPVSAPTDDVGEFVMSRWTRWTRAFFKPPEPTECPLPGTPPESWGRAVVEVLRGLLRHLAYVVRASLPLMLVAGLLGALLVELAPLEALAAAVVNPAVLVGVAVLGTLLPVPMSFDVLMASMLYAAGAPLEVAATMLFTLGLFSVYPMMIVWKNLRPALAVALAVVVAGTGLAFGLGAASLQARSTTSALEYYGEHGAHRDARALMAWIQAECGGTADDPQPCLEAFARRALADGEDISVCRMLSAERQPGCLSAATFEATRRAAIRAGSVTGCETLSTSEDRGQCQRLVVDALTRDNPDLTVCEALGTKAEVDQCQLVVLRSWVELRGDGSLCTTLTSLEAQKQCQGFAGTALVALQRDPELCEAFEDEQQSKFCLDRVATMMVDEATSFSENDDRCDGLPEQLVDPCRRRWSFRWARDLGEPSLCNTLGETEARTTCIRDSTVERILGEVRRRRAALVGAHIEGAPVNGASTATAAAPLPAGPVPASRIVSEGPPRITATPFLDSKSVIDGRFVRHMGPALGIDGLPRFTGLDFHEPWVNGRGLAAGDFDGDGWTDLAFATRVGPKVFRNLGGLRFAPVPVNPALQDADSLAVAFVDLDGDSRLDLFVSAYGSNVRAIMNDGGRLEHGRIVDYPNPGALVALAPAFADTNRDGTLDVYLGNWSFGSERGFETLHSQNALLLSVGAAQIRQILPEAPGETLSALFADLNGDRGIDLVVGNDFDRPDHFYLGTGEGRFALLGRQSGVVPITPLHTMSIDSGDFDNDMHTDLFMVDMSFGPPTPDVYCDALEGGFAERCKVTEASYRAFESARMGDCVSLPAPADEVDVQTCMAAVLTQFATRSRAPEICAQLPDYARSLRRFCDAVIAPGVAPPLPMGDWMRQASVNKLLVGDGVGRFMDSTNRLGVEKSGWSWNARFVDLDDDKYQDIYVGNGYKFLRPTPNVFFRNLQASRFEDQAAAVGLDERLNVPAFISADLDLDGDLDLVMTTVGGPVVVYENRLSKGRSIEIELRDEVGNRFGIGSRIRIEGDDAARTRQMRDVRASGGYLSFDAPIVHFGLDEDSKVRAIEVDWSTGQSSRYEGPFEGRHRYRIERTIPR